MKHIKLFENFEEGEFNGSDFADGVASAELMDHIIDGLESGELSIVSTETGFFISDSEGEDNEAYYILPYDDEDFGSTSVQFKGWHIVSEMDGIDEDISPEDVEIISEYVE